MRDDRCFLPSSSEKVQDHRPAVNAAGEKLSIGARVKPELTAEEIGVQECVAEFTLRVVFLA